MQGNDTKPSLLKSTLYHWNTRAHVQFHLSVSKVNKRSSLRTITTFDRNSSIKWSCFSGQRASSPKQEQSTGALSKVLKSMQTPTPGEDFHCNRHLRGIRVSANRSIFSRSLWSQTTFHSKIKNPFNNIKSLFCLYLTILSSTSTFTFLPGRFKRRLKVNSKALSTEQI